MDSFRGNNAYDRLSALRQSAPPPRDRRSQISRPLIFAVGGVIALVLLGTAFLVMNSNPRQELVEAIETTLESVPVESPNVDTLLEGEAYIAVAAAVGTFPPSLAPGDTVQVVVAPNLNTGDLARTLAEQGVVRDIHPPSEFGNTFVITIRAPQSVATAMIDAEKVHLVVVDEVAS